MCEESYKIKHKCVVNTLKMLNFDAFLFVSEVNRFWISGIKVSEGLWGRARTDPAGKSPVCRRAAPDSRNPGDSVPGQFPDGGADERISRPGAGPESADPVWNSDQGSDRQNRRRKLPAARGPEHGGQQPASSGSAPGACRAERFIPWRLITRLHSHVSASFSIR